MFTVKTIGRACEGCTKCCEGWLSGTAYGYDFSPYKKCAFLKNGCSIYEQRPIDPCKTFECQWKSNRIFPDWLKPDKSHVIILKRHLDIFDFYMFFSTGKKIEKNVHDWADEFTRKSNRNHIVISEAQTNKIYSQHRHFKELANKKFNPGS